ncbi:transcriptional regulator, partial [Acinetobacter baumannii]|nr:transcriptional regulator [Acinetobacter baumannii]
MYGCFFCLRAYALRNRTGGIMPLTALKLFKNLS